MKIDDSLVQYAHDYIKTIIEKFGPRYSCSKQEHDANEWTKNELATFCDEVTMEDFKTEVDLYPMGIIKVVGTLGTLAAAFIPLGFGLPFVATALIVLALLIFYEEMFLVGRWIRPFFKKGTSSNTWGVVKPEKEVKWRVIIDGHVDSAKQMRIAEKESISAVPLIFGFLYLFYTATIGIVKGLGELLPGDFIGTQYQNAILHWSVLDWVYFIPIIFLMPCLFYIVRGLTGDTVVPGASDNLSGCAVAAVVARYFNKNKLNHVEVIAGSFGSEECGDMGAKDFAARHGDL
nr:M28 family peptidase [Candidatus Sigynarchaeota archaeon]